jgi:hypothetical protein
MFFNEKLRPKCQQASFFFNVIFPVCDQFSALLLERHPNVLNSKVQAYMLLSY